MMNVRLTQIDGKLPNLALMRLAAHHRRRGDQVYFSRHIMPDLFEPKYDLVYASAIFGFSVARLERFKRQWPDAIIGGTGSGEIHGLEDVVPGIALDHDYEIYPDYEYSIGFLQRGCRLKCPFCVVPKKEGKPRQEMTVAQLWRGPGYPKKLHILDNDFFGVPGWQRHIKDIISSKFKVCLNQGINVRLINAEAAEALAAIEYRDDQFQRRRIYTAWDNLGDEGRFFKGIDLLEEAGIPAKHIMAYMLVGYDKRETWERIFHRFDRMVERGILPYPMVFDLNRKDLRHFQRWVVTGLYRAVSWNAYRERVSASLPADDQIGRVLT